MAYINKIVVNGQEVNANQLEGILDKDGHNRFIEGLTGELEITGITNVYNHWSLSGTHLMIVLAFANETENNISIPQWSVGAQTVLPSWVYDKIYPIGASNVVSMQAIQGINITALSTESTGTVYMQKAGSNTVNVVFPTAITAKAGYYYRIQIDLVIDNASD